MDDSHAYPNIEICDSDSDSETCEFITPIKRRPDADYNKTSTIELEVSPYHADSIEDLYSHRITDVSDDGNCIPDIEFSSPYVSTVDIENFMIKSPEILVTPSLSPIGRNKLIYYS